MFNRAIIAFRKSIFKSQSSTAISNSDRDEDDDRCDESIVFNHSLPDAPPVSHLTLLKRQRHSQNVDDEGDEIFLI